MKFTSVVSNPFERKKWRCETEWEKIFFFFFLNFSVVGVRFEPRPFGFLAAADIKKKKIKIKIKIKNFKNRSKFTDFLKIISSGIRHRRPFAIPPPPPPPDRIDCGRRFPQAKGRDAILFFRGGGGGGGWEKGRGGGPKPPKTFFQRTSAIRLRVNGLSPPATPRSTEP